MKKYNLSQIMKRAWELVKKAAQTMSEALKKAWKEAKEMKEDLMETLKANLEEMAYNNYNINIGIDRKVITREKDGRTYLTIACYTANGRYKGNYKAGYVENGTYVCGRYDDINAIEKEYIGR